MADIVIRGIEIPKEPTNITIYPDGAWCDYTTNDHHGKFVILPEGHARPVVRGHWILDRGDTAACSNCGNEILIRNVHSHLFCNNCGADMTEV